MLLELPSAKTFSHLCQATEQTRARPVFVKVGLEILGHARHRLDLIGIDRTNVQYNLGLLRMKWQEHCNKCRELCFFIVDNNHFYTFMGYSFRCLRGTHFDVSPG